jgi:hypothetical protein
MELDLNGAQHFPGAFTATQVAALIELLADKDGGRPGTRLPPHRELSDHITPATTIARAILGSVARPVRATLFDKTPDRNWTLGWHQDRTIAVRTRIDTPGFTHWTIKAGIHHVMPPIELLQRMLTLRIHLDPVGPENAPLLIAPGSHRDGRIPEPNVAEVVARHGAQTCLAQAGDVWLYATLILHASARAADPSRRRVLQLVYSTDDLPNGLKWLGV